LLELQKFTSDGFYFFSEIGNMIVKEVDKGSGNLRNMKEFVGTD
jgi:hypothetical protein